MIVEDGSASCSDLPATLVKRGVYSCHGGGHTHNHITKGAIAGIVVGAVLGTALLCGLITWFLLKRRRTSVQEMINTSASERPPLPAKEQRSSYGYYDVRIALSITS